MSNDSEDIPQISPGDLVNEQVARNMAESADPPDPPPAASLPRKSPVSGPQADVYASVSSSVQAAQLPQAAASTGPVAAPPAPARQESVNVNQDYFQSPERSDGVQGQPAPVDFSPLLQAIQELTSALRESKPESPKDRQQPEFSQRAETVGRTPESQDKPAGLSEKRPVEFNEIRFPEPPKKLPTRNQEPERQQERPVEPMRVAPAQQSPMSQSPVRASWQPSGPQQQPQDSNQQVGKFQQEMQKYLAGNSQALQQVLGAIESITAAVSQQNTKIQEVQSKLAQLTQFASSTYQRSQRAGYR